MTALSALPLETVLPLLEAAGYPGFGSARLPRVCCPFHQENAPSCQLYPPPDAHFRCYGCGAHGDLVKLLAGALFPDEHPGWGWYHAWITLTEGGTRLTGGRALTVAAAPDALGPEEQGALGTALHHYRDALWGADPAGRAYLARRFPKDARALDAVLREDGVGYADAAGAQRVRAALAPYPDAETWLKRVGVLRTPGAEPRLTRRVVFPEARPGRGSVYYQARDVAPPDARFPRQPYLSPPFRKRALGVGHACQRPRLPVLVVEGPMDRLAARIAGYASIALLGSSPPEELGGHLTGRDVVDALDNDRGGDQARERLQRHLGGARTVKRIALPRGMDPADVVRAGGAIALQRLVE